MATGLSVKKIKPEDLHIHILSPKIKKAFLMCTKLPVLAKSGWYLAGGTALALQVGHRRSLDLDFFTPQKKFNELEVERELLSTGHWQTKYREKGTIYGIFMRVKMSLIAYPFFIPSKKRLQCGTIKILIPEDIAAMKIVAISQRGRKRDFFDLYWYCKNRESLEKVILRAIRQYPGQEDNVNHIIKSLSYFTDAEADPMPQIFFEVTWKKVKKFFQDEAVRLSKKLIF